MKVSREDMRYIKNLSIGQDAGALWAKFVSGFVCAGLICSGVQVHAQHWEMDMGVGSFNYQGELRAERLTWKGMAPAVSAGLRRWVGESTVIAVRCSTGKLTGRDADNPHYLTRRRNLHFETRIHECVVNGQYHFKNVTSGWFSPFINAGLALFSVNPFTRDQQGVRYSLYDLSLEGQGLSQYPSLKTPGRLNLSIPVGAGFSLNVADGLRVELEMLTRKTFTDQIDGVSGYYPQEETLRSARGAIAVDLSYRGDELPGEDPLFPSAGTQRGNPKTMDWYYGFMLRFVWHRAESTYAYPPKRKLFKPKGWPYRL
jgi:hypothetical protein